MTPGLKALTESAAVIDLSSCGRIRVTGEDRARLLHAMSTNHVEGMKPGDAQYTFFLNAQGQIQADAYVLCFEDHLLLDVEPEVRQSLYEHLDHFIIADDVTLEDVTDQMPCFAIEGPQAEANAAAISFTGAPGYRIYGTAAPEGLPMATMEDAEAARIMHFKPRYGHDFTDRTLPQETQQMKAAVHFQKGCYLGQEIVERVRSRGHVNRLIIGFAGGFTGDADTPPAVGAKVAYGDKEDGDVTSAVVVDGKLYGLAIVRSQIAKPGTLVGIDGRPASLVAPWGA
jgi:folate-binding protein YgfZ